MWSCPEPQPEEQTVTPWDWHSPVGTFLATKGRW